MKEKQILMVVLRLVHRLGWLPFFIVNPGRRKRRKNTAGDA